MAQVILFDDVIRKEFLFHPEVLLSRHEGLEIKNLDIKIRELSPQGGYQTVE